LTLVSSVFFRKKFNRAFYRYIHILCGRRGNRAARLIAVNTFPELLNSVPSGDGVAIVPAV
jgi:hypothetical protein